MGAVDPQVIIRMGTHAEKDYLDKTLKFFDGVILGANLVEATPGATASLLFRFCGKKRALPYYIDPMSYAFGEYVDDANKVRTDLDWIKSEQKRAGKMVRDFKRSYVGLADALGGPFAKAIARKGAIRLSDFKDAKATADCCKMVADYQYSRIKREFEKVSELADFGSETPRPAAVFAPYFYIEPSQHQEWLDVVLQLARVTKENESRCPVHAVICVDEAFLRDADFVARLQTDLPKTGVAGVWLWFSRLLEDQSDEETLTALRRLVEKLSQRMKVFNMHGGYFSLSLSKFGMSGVSHGIGYGEQKDVLPVIGQSTPTVRYYLPDSYKRLSVPAVQRCFKALDIRKPSDFHQKVCDCVICKGVVAKNVEEFSAFGDMHYSRAESKRLAQTPAAAKRCRFHFLLCRIRERNWMKDASVDDIVERLVSASKKWGKQPSLVNDLHHLRCWRDVLKAE